MTQMDSYLAEFRLLTA